MKKMDKLYICLLAMGLLYSCETIEKKPQKVMQISIVNQGIYRAEIVGEGINSANGLPITVVKKFDLVEKTNRIPIERGKRFGFYIFVNNTGMESIEVEIRIIHPEFFDPYMGALSSVNMSKMVIKDGTMRYEGYILEEDYEMVSGEWRFEVWYKGRMYTKQIFILEK